MEVTESHFQSVRVLRHTFRPSFPLASQLEKFVTKGSQGALLLASTREVEVDGLAFVDSRYDLQIRELEKRFHRTDKVDLGEVRYKQLGSGALQLLFTPLNQQVFNVLTQPIDELPSLVRRPESFINFGLTMTLNEARLVDESALETAKRELQEAMGANALSYATPDRITGSETIRHVSQAIPEWPQLAS